MKLAVMASGTAVNDAGQFVTAGGRVLSVTATALTVAKARERAYQAVDLIHWNGEQHRTDIAAGE